jgi:hypothetical protein
MAEPSLPPGNRVFLAVLALVSLASYWSCARFIRTPRPIDQYASILLFAALSAVAVICAVRGLLGWRQRRRTSVALGAAALLSFAGLFAARDAGVWLRDRDFERLRPAMERLVEASRRSLDSSTQPESVAVPGELRPPIYSIRASRNRAGRLDVWFFNGFGFPQRHSAWIFTSDSSASPASVRGSFWHRSRKLSPHWYDASD